MVFDQVLREQSLNLDGVVRLIVDDEEIVHRLGGRRTCPVCNTPYHPVSKPPRVPGVCDHDGAALVQRDDDREEIIRERLRVFPKPDITKVAKESENGSSPEPQTNE